MRRSSVLLTLLTAMLASETSAIPQTKASRDRGESTGALNVTSEAAQENQRIKLDARRNVGRELAKLAD